MRFILELYVENIIQVNSRLKQHCLLEPLEIQNVKPLSAFLKRGEYIENEQLLLNLSGIEAFFSELKGYLAKLFSKKVYLVYLMGRCRSKVVLRQKC